MGSGRICNTKVDDESATEVVDVDVLRGTYNDDGVHPRTENENSKRRSIGRCCEPSTRLFIFLNERKTKTRDIITHKERKIQSNNPLM